MSEVTISKNRLTVLWVAIIALLILAIFLYFRTTQPSQPANLKNFLDSLNKETIVATIDKGAKLTFFNYDLSSLKSCGELKNNTVPPECGLNGDKGAELSKLTAVTVLEFRDGPDTTIVSEGQKLYRKRICYNSLGQPIPCP